MQASWWQYRSWKLLADMNGDGATNMGDAWLWAQFVFFLPGDAFIAQFGPTELGRYLGLTQASFGSATAAWLSAGLWVLGIWALIYLFGFLLDAIDPTYRQQQRELRQAKVQARREGHGRPVPREPVRRIEPTLSADYQTDAAQPQADAATRKRPRRVAA